MPKINVLSPHVADLIAAGEVVERPASVVKELMENAVDAGAKSVTVEIMRGGMSYIRVTDDGGGIPPDEAETAFLRHATSKLRTEFDLEAIGTLGFRGEALAAISSVARVEVVTRTADRDLGTALTLEGGEVLSKEEAGGPVGTTMLVRDLFFNTPARLKYMKKDTAEGAAVCAAVQHEALAHPEVAVKFLRDGKQELLTPGDGQLKSAVYSVLGRDLALGFLPVRGSGEDAMVVEGFVSLPACCRASRSSQFFFVNGRYVKSRLMMAALEEAYRNQRMVGKFPGCVLGLNLRLGAVDVNVHPAKTEVRFLSEKRVFDAVYHAVLGALEAKPAGATRTAAPAFTPPAPRRDTVTPNQTAFQTMAAAQYRGAVSAPPAHALNDVTRPLGAPILWAKPPTTARPSALTKEVNSAPAAVKPQAPADSAPPELSAPAEEPEPPAQAPTAPWTLRGELFHTYVLVEQGDTAFLIDKHAAHERVNFDKLKAAGYTPMGQQLLSPVAFTPSAEEGEALLENLPLLADFGFEAEAFGGGAVLVRQCPEYVDAGEIETVLTELAETLLTAGQADPAGARDALMATMACKAAIKGGQKNDTEELMRVAEAVMTGAVKYCPHGRPVAVELTRGQLEKMFKRA